jgi:transposase
MDNLLQENKQLKKEIKELTKRLEVAEQKIQELITQLNQNSHNSSWPASRDKSRKKKRNLSLRKKSKKKAGGQTGHPGQTLEMRSDPTHIETHRPQVCNQCQSSFDESQVTVDFKRRQVIDIPPLTLTVTEYRTETLVCSCCGATTSGNFPSTVTNPVQYGPGIQQLAVYLKNQQFIPYERSQQFLADLFGLNLSPGTLQNIIKKAAQRLKPFLTNIKTALTNSAVAHFDESGIYIQGKRFWFHTVGTNTMTAYYPHRKRGKDATESMGILPGFQGTAVHDHWSAYWYYKGCRHALCNVHHLRDLNGIIENFKQHWAKRFKLFLLAAKNVADRAKQGGLTALPQPKMAQIERLYTQLVSAALRANPPPRDGWPQGKRGRPKKNKARNLAERFEKHQRAVLAFVYDFKVPFDNNLAERDIRMVKVQQKVSGCFRSWHGADDFCTIRSYISTIRKQGLNVWQALGSIFSGDLLLPDLTPV